MRLMTRILLAAVSILSSSGCGPSVNLVTGLRVKGLSTGWLDSGGFGDLNKLVPTVSFSLTNVSGEPLPLLQVNAVFRRVGEAAEWGARFATAADPRGLQPGASTRVLMLTSDLGYTGADPREEMLRNSRFVDADVDLFVKYRSTQWVRLGRFPVQRLLLVSLRQ